MKVVINIDGGIGRVICSIPALEQLCKTRSDVEIITPWPDVFQNNPHVKKVHLARGPQSNLWPTLIQNSDYRHPEPYHHYLYYTKQHHLIESFHYLLNGKPKMEVPNVYLSGAEQQTAQTLIQAIKEQQNADKVIIFQPFGGTARRDGHIVHDNTNRSLSLAASQHILNNLPPNTRVIYRGILPFSHPRCLARTNFSVRETLALVQASDGVVGIDSCAQHMAYALNKPAVVLWGSTAVENVGYPNFTNISRPGFPKAYVPYRFDFDQSINKGAMDFTTEELALIIHKIKEMLKG